MPLYRYMGRNSQGQGVNGTLEAPDEAAMIRTLQSRGIFVLKVEKALQEKQIRLKVKQLRRKNVKLEDLVSLCNELAVLLNAGVKIIRALDLIIEQIQSQALLEAVMTIQKDLEAGLTFAQAITKHPKVFPDLWVYIVEAGEVSGNLPMVLQELGRYLEMRDSLNKKVFSAMMYPSVLMSVAIGAIIFFMLKVIPIFGNMFKSFKAELPLPTRIVMGMSNAMQKYFLIIFIVLSVGIYLFRRFLKTPTGKRALDAFVLRIPMIGTFIRNIILARVAVNMAVLIKSGVDFLKSLDIVAKVSGNSYYRDALNQVMIDVREGKLASEAMMKNPLFPSQMVQMIQIGEESGQLEEMLRRLGIYYENRVSTFISRINVLIEPVMLLFVGGVIGFLVVSMFLPIFNMSKAIK